jgi:hypothetical protein
MKIRLKWLLTTTGVMLICVLWSIGCGTADVNSEDARIIPGVSIEGVTLGDPQMTVERTVGRPDDGGTVDGIYRSWYITKYLQGRHAGLMVYFVDAEGAPRLVDELSVTSPYDGSTKEGIGIGSSYKMVRQTYGIPGSSVSKPADHWITDFYCYGNRRFEIHYTDSMVAGITTGSFFPILQDTRSPCK